MPAHVGKIASFVKHLNKFTEPARGCSLQRAGSPRQYIYRFENPLLQPFVILNGVTNDLIDERTLVELQDKARGVEGDGGTLSLGLE